MTWMDALRATSPPVFLGVGSLIERDSPNRLNKRLPVILDSATPEKRLPLLAVLLENYLARPYSSTRESDRGGRLRTYVLNEYGGGNIPARPRRQIPKWRAGFQVRKDTLCPSCLDRGALDLLGRPRFNKTYGFFKTLHCEDCGGSGRVAVEDRRDPYDTGKGTSHISS